ncbi:MAG: hypothetical protein KGK08_14375 [Acidobacteriota bacterium]|nr:hypothetical protein [Acidobacteriota bacterium]
MSSPSEWTLPAESPTHEDVEGVVARLEFAVLASDTGVELERKRQQEQERARYHATLAATQQELSSVRAELATTEARLRVELAKESEVRLHELEQQLRDNLASALVSLQEQRQNYFDNVELEVVKLALAIAARILHREVQLDPLLLRGVVNVVLKMLTDTSVTQLRVPAAQQKAWQETLQQHHMDDVDVIADETLNAGDCTVVTSVGTVGLGVDVQLQEIERGFFDLLQQRPT